jgi:hypothetical protein
MLSLVLISANLERLWRIGRIRCKLKHSINGNRSSPHFLSPHCFELSLKFHLNVLQLCALSSTTQCSKSPSCCDVSSGPHSTLLVLVDVGISASKTPESEFANGDAV